MLTSRNKLTAQLVYDKPIIIVIFFSIVFKSLNSKMYCVFSLQEKQKSPSKMSVANVPSQDNLVSADSGEKSMSADENKPSSHRTEVTADEQTASTEPDEIFRPPSEGKDISLEQSESVFLQ